MKLGGSQNPAQSVTRSHHDGRVKASAFALGLWTRTRSRGPWWPGPMRSAVAHWAPSRSGRWEERWPIRGGGGGEGGVFLVQFFGYGRPCDHAATSSHSSSSMTCPRSCGAAASCTHSAHCAGNRRNSPLSVLGAGLDSPLLCIDRCAAYKFQEVCDMDRHPGANCGDSTGAVLGHGVR